MKMSQSERMGLPNYKHLELKNNFIKNQNYNDPDFI